MRTKKNPDTKLTGGGFDDNSFEMPPVNSANSLPDGSNGSSDNLSQDLTASSPSSSPSPSLEQSESLPSNLKASNVLTIPDSPNALSSIGSLGKSSSGSLNRGSSASRYMSDPLSSSTTSSRAGSSSTDSFTSSEMFNSPTSSSSPRNSKANNGSTDSSAGQLASPSPLYWSSRLFSASPKPHGIMLLEWMESVIDYCREKYSKITIPEELEKYRYAKACLDSIVNEVRKIRKVSDRDVNQNISCPSFKLSYRLEKIGRGRTKIMSLIDRGSISFDTLVSDLKEQIESISKNYQHSDQHTFKRQFLAFLINSLDTCLKDAGSSSSLKQKVDNKLKESNAENSLKQEVDIKLEELKDEVSKETSELTDIVRYAPQDSAASIALRLPLEPLTGKKVQAMYDHVCLLSDLQNNKELLTSLPKIISELKGELITNIKAYKEAYLRQGEAVTPVKQEFVKNLLTILQKYNLLDHADATQCNIELGTLKQKYKPNKVSFSPIVSAVDHQKFAPFYTEFRSISRVEKFYNRAFNLVRCAQAVSDLSKPNVDSKGSTIV